MSWCAAHRLRCSYVLRRARFDSSKGDLSLRILQVHNAYQQSGGEDAVRSSEDSLLRSAGHVVIHYFRDNNEIAAYGLLKKSTLGLRTIWAWDSHREITELLRAERPDVAHFHNTFPLISPAAYYACRAAGVPVVQTLHNYRLLCPAGVLFRCGRVCEECIKHSLWRGVLHACYRSSRGKTSAVALMLTVHRWLGTWMHVVDCYITLTEFSRRKFIEAGLPAEKIAVKPNFVRADPGTCKGAGECAVFVGRLSGEKGLQTLLTAWELLNSRIPLEIVGDGPLRPTLQNEAQRRMMGGVHFRGWMVPDETLAAIKQARFLVFPSECYEGFPVAIAEAFACGVPVIASRLGAMQEIVQDGCTGLHFTPGNADDLAAKVGWAWAHPKEMAAMGRAARAEYEAKYTAERNYQMLMEIYQRVLGARGSGEVAHSNGPTVDGVRRFGIGD
jgi:glycosyltransferase involved in cell wall biosynthesis